MAIGRNTATLWQLATSAAPQTVTTNYSSGDLICDQYDQLAFDINIAAAPGGTAPTLTAVVQRKGADGAYYPIYTSAALNTAGVTSVSIGPGLPNNAAIGNTIRVLLNLGGTGPSFSVSGSLLAK